MSKGSKCFSHFDKDIERVWPALLLHFMERKFKQGWSSIPPISKRPHAGTITKMNININMNSTNGYLQKYMYGITKWNSRHWNIAQWNPSKLNLENLLVFNTNFSSISAISWHSNLEKTGILYKANFKQSPNVGNFD